MQNLPWCSGPWVPLVHDNAWSHVARLCRQFLNYESIDTIDWCSCSKTRIQLRTVKELTYAVIQVWEEFPKDAVSSGASLDVVGHACRHMGAKTLLTYIMSF